MAETETRFLPKVADAYFEVDGITAFIAKANTAANVSITTNKTEKRGGQDNAIIGTIFSDGAVNIGFTSGSWQPEYLAASIGSTIAIRKDLQFHSENLSYQVDAQGKITLAEAPADGKISIPKDGGYISIDVSTLEVDLTPYGFKEGDCVSCLMMLKRSGKRIGIATDITPLTGKLTLSSPIFAGSRGRIGTAEYVFPTFQFGGNFTHNFSTDASYELSGSALATASNVCGNGDEFGYYQEYLADEDEISVFTRIVAVPSPMSVTAGEKATISVYGLKNALYDRQKISDKLTFSIETEDQQYATVNSTTGEVTGVAATTTNPITVTVKYNGTLTDTVPVNVSSK